MPLKRSIQCVLTAVKVLCGLASAAWAEGNPAPNPGIEAVVFVPKTGSPLQGVIQVPLDIPLEKDRTVTATIVPGSVENLPPSCALALAANVMAPVVGTTSVTVSIGAPSIPCGGGKHNLRLHLAAQASGAAPVTLKEVAVTLWIRFEPSLEVLPTIATPVVLKQVTCYWCWSPFSVNASGAAATFIKSQSVDIRNGSIGSISVMAAVVAQGASPTSSANAIQVVHNMPLMLEPGERATLQITAPDEPRVGAGTYDMRLSLTATERVGTQPLSNVTMTPVRLDVRYGVSWVCVALFLGWLFGRGFTLVQDPVFVANAEFLQHLRYVQRLAALRGAPDKTKEDLSNIETALQSLWGPVSDALKTKLAEIERSLEPTFASSPAPGATPTGARLHVPQIFTSISWLLTGTRLPVDIGLDIVRPSLQLVILLAGVISGIKINYTDATTFGANGLLLDLLPVFIWGATTIAVAKTLDSFKR